LFFFPHPVEPEALPRRFTYPFQYQPHSLCVEAAALLQERLNGLPALEQHLELATTHEGPVCGKMFGVLVVQNAGGKTGWVAAFSGKLADSQHQEGFVPPVFDLLDEKGFYRAGEAALTALNHRIAALEQAPEWVALREEMILLEQQHQAALEDARVRLRLAKERRRAERATLKQSGTRAEQEHREQLLSAESQRDHYWLKDLKKQYAHATTLLQARMLPFLERMEALHQTRKAQSAALQQRIFQEYRFLNALGEEKSLLDIFAAHEQGIPPAGAGECAAPKLLQYAFRQGLKPLAFAEFWWGPSPIGEVRKHGHFYPACRGKCVPVLAHMLQGIAVEEPPAALTAVAAGEMSIAWEDDYLLVVRKPVQLLSVPGKSCRDSVETRVRTLYPACDGPMIVHRLDQATSGLLLIAKQPEVYKALQSQFLHRTIQKRYVAVLQGVLPADSGTIDLPLRVDLDNRPHQMVCYQHGKSARTLWEVVARTDTATRVHFYPVTGRTHQLRVHAAHPQGLNAPIQGDDLYGTPADRLYLHAEYLCFVHPVTREKIETEWKAPF
jgi:tRNA pseudouridine32 synthase/23S rRNA pseudouridine746 synthase